MFFQRVFTPIPMVSIKIAIKGTNSALKYGGPTDSLAPVKESRISGYSVPNSTIAVATTKMMLLISSSVSFDQKPKPTLLFTTGARITNKVKDAPTATSKNTKINTPRSGSAAKACTEVSTPERTKKVPSKLREKAAIANNTVQFLKTPRFSVTANE